MPGPYRSPGVYVEEAPSGVKPIEEAETGIAVFIGYTEKGQMDKPTLISGWSQYHSQFGGILEEVDSVIGASTVIGDPMGYAVYNFFQNGGREAYIVRCTSGAPLTSAATDSNNALTCTAINEGKWGDSLVVRITPQNQSDAVNDMLNVSIGTGIDADFVAQEVFSEATLTNTDTSYIENVINGVSELITVEVNHANVAVARTTFNGTTDGYMDFELSGGHNGNKPTRMNYQAAFTALENYRDINIVLLPGQYWDGSISKAIIEEGISHCEKMTNRMIIFDPSPGAKLESENDVQDLSLTTSSYAVLYYPWVNTDNFHYYSSTNSAVSRTVMVSPAAHAAGMWAKTDRNHGVWKAPAGVETSLLGISSLEFAVENIEHGYLNSQGVNALRRLPNYGTVIWGARTRSTRSNPEWRYIPVRRTAIFIEESLYRGTQWAVCEPNDHQLWSALCTSINVFMNVLFRKGAFQGEKPSDAYFVHCGLGSTMSQSDIDSGHVIVEVGFAPLKPAEFVIIQIKLLVDRH